MGSNGLGEDSGPAAGGSARTDQFAILRRVVTRRRVLVGLGLAAAAPVLAACGGETPPPPKTTTSSAPATSSAATSATSSAATSATSAATTSAAATKPAATKFGPQASLSIVVGSHFVPSYDEYRKKFIEEWGKKNNVKTKFDTVPPLNVQVPLAAEVAAGAGHDIIQMAGAPPYLWEKNLVDLTDIMEPMGKKYGGWYDLAVEVGQVNGKWVGDPDYWIANILVWRMDLFKQNGLKKPETWDDLYQAAKLLKPKGHQTGIAISHCDDANLFLRAFLACHGATINDKDTNITVNTPQMREALKKFYELFRDGMTDEVFSWDNASDNRLIDSGVACFVQDALSAYRSANPRLQANLGADPGVKGPAAHVTYGGYQPLGIWNFSKNIDVAKQFMVDLMDDWKNGVVASQGYNMPYLKDLAKKPMPVLGEDPKLQSLQDILVLNRNIGWPAPLDLRTSAVYIDYLLPDFVGRVVKGKATDKAIDDAMKWMEDSMKATYDRVKK